MSRITIVIPTYNRAQTVVKAIDSALAQDRVDLGCVVVDDGSTDDTAGVLARYEGDPRVTVVRCPVNKGVTGAKNTGLDSLPGDCEYFGILDSDDVLVPGAITSLMEVFERGEEYSQVFGWCADPATGERTGRARPGIITYEDAISGGMDGEFWQLVRRDVLGDCRFEERAPGSESYLWFRLWKKAPGFLIPGVVRLYDRSGTDRVSRPRFDAKASAGRMIGYRAVLEVAGADLKRICPRRYTEYRFEEAKWAALAGRRKEAFRALQDGFGAHPCLRALRIAAVISLPAGVLRQVYERRYRSG